jgi:putative endonuclease
MFPAIMPTPHQQRLGRQGEELACGELRRRGYAILARGFRTRHGEIDIVARDGDVLVFVEVKARSSRGFGGALGAVTPRKQRQVMAMAQRYMARVGWAARPCRFDVVAVQADVGAAPDVTLIRNAFGAGWP